MFPIVLDLEIVPVALVGSGQLASKRLTQLIQAGAKRLTVFSESDDTVLAALAGERLIRRLPTDEDLAAFQVIYIVDLEPGIAAGMAARCRALGRLVNVEDVKHLCDFHTPSQVRRGGSAPSRAHSIVGPGHAAEPTSDSSASRGSAGYASRSCRRVSAATIRFVLV